MESFFGRLLNFNRNSPRQDNDSQLANRVEAHLNDTGEDETREMNTALQAKVREMFPGFDDMTEGDQDEALEGARRAVKGDSGD